MPDNTIPEPAKTKARILFVEDEATLREHLAEKLSDEYVVDTAGNGNEALLAVIRAKPALVVSDIVMPDMDGVELLKTLRQSPSTRGIPVLLISGRAADEYRVEGFEQGADGFLAKPYTERELRALIGSMLRAARSRGETAVRHARDQMEPQAAEVRANLKRAVAELRSCEELLRQNRQELTVLQAGVRLRRESVAAVAHNMSERLMGILGVLDSLRAPSPADVVAQQAVGLLDQQAGQLVSLVNELLDVNRRE